MADSLMRTESKINVGERDRKTPSWQAEKHCHPEQDNRPETLRGAIKEPRSQTIKKNLAAALNLKTVWAESSK
jgi:hypothetical protein